jgi:hypothetical protein
MLYRLTVLYKNDGYQESLSRGSFSENKRVSIDDKRLMIKLIPLKKIVTRSIEKHSGKKIGKMAIDFVILQDFKLVLFSVERLVLVPEFMLPQFAKEQEAEANVPLLNLFMRRDSLSDLSHKQRRRMVSRVSTDADQDLLSNDLFREIMIKAVERRIDDSLVTERLRLARDCKITPDDRKKCMPSREQVETDFLNLMRARPKLAIHRRSSLIPRGAVPQHIRRLSEQSKADTHTTLRQGSRGRAADTGEDSTVRLASKHVDTAVKKLQPTYSESKLKRYADYKQMKYLQHGGHIQPFTDRHFVISTPASHPVIPEFDNRPQLISKTEQTKRRRTTTGASAPLSRRSFAQLSRRGVAPLSSELIRRNSSVQNRAMTSKSKREFLEVIYKRSSSMENS